MAQLSNMKKALLDTIGTLLGNSDTETVQEEDISDIKISLRNILIRHETNIMWIQSLLVWENPLHTGILFFVLNVVFWLFLQLRLFYIIGLVGFCVMTYDLWCHYIWPEIRVPQETDGEMEEWTHVHPRMLSVPDICTYLGNVADFSSNSFHFLMQMRTQKPTKFFACSVCFCLCLGLVGHYIPGTYLVYMSLLSIFLVPMLHYHRHLDYLYIYVKQLLCSLETQTKRSMCHSKPLKEGSNEEDSETEDLKSLLPTAIHPEDANLATQNEDTESELSRLSPDFTARVLDEDSDDDTQMQGLPAEMPSVLSMAETLSLDSRFNLPQHGNAQSGLDGSSDEDSDVWDVRDSGKSCAGRFDPQIRFEPQHFESGQAEEQCGGLEEGLEFPDMDESGCGECSQAVGAEELLGGPVSVLLQSAMAGLSELGGTTTQQSPPRQSSAEHEDFELLSQDDIK